MNRLALTVGLLTMSGWAVATIETGTVDAPPTLALMGLGVVVAVLFARYRKR